MKGYEAAEATLSSVSRRALVERPRLDEKLALSLHYQSTLVHAPHGYGKTTAIAQFISSAGISHAYMQCSPQNNNPNVFATHLSRMLISLLSRVEESAEPADVQISRMVALLGKQSEPKFLIFDDVQFLHHKHITSWFTFLVAYLPETVHLILIGTDVAVFPKASMHRDAVLQITRDDLAFTQVEGRRLAAYFADDIDDETLTLMLENTWGSPLLLKACFAKGAIQHDEQVKGRIHELDPYFLPIWEEVPKKAETALVYTALLGTYFLGKEHEKLKAGVMLLVEKSLFVEMTGDGEVLIHPLFRSYVLNRVKAGKNRRIEHAVAQAVADLGAATLYRKAISIALSIDDYDLVASLLDEYCATLLSNGYLDFVTGAIEQLPQTPVEQYASLLLLEILSGIRKGWTAKHVMDRIARIQSSRLRKKMQEVDLLSILDGIDFLLQRDFYHAEKLLSKLPDELTYLRPLISVFIASLPLGPEEDLEQVYHHLQETLRTIGVKQYDALSIVLLGQIGSIQLELLLFEQARQSFDEALRLGYEEKSGYATSCSIAWIGKGLLSLYSGMREDAEEYLLRGLASAKGYSFYLSLHAQLALVEFYIVSSRHEEAVRLLRDAGKQAYEYDVTSIDDRFIEVMYAMAQRRVGDIPALEMWVHKHQEEEAQQDTLFDLFVLEERQVLGYYQITGQQEKAVALYASLQSELKKKHRLLLSMILSMEFGDYESQQVDFSRSQISEKHISVLQELYGVKQEGEDQLLTDREQEVLHLIGKGYMNKEIAGMMHITERTVKWHASRIYEKLQVSTRTEAVAEAQNLGIL
ncbi:LuxR C-terminal-related transcriptional regulator [uncultured Sphaerochaeta sp.]|uniref:LuxR C-terminal-related transcriptional regulator n=1 Tax=uncultured Sphaerochaeta sp. TaxID=886478 RepID=UPI002A0A31D1|nr:LuxR C-terminal-related transcriptional regulator [uncultured Sphaerochaeta sp.]